MVALDLLSIAIVWMFGRVTPVHESAEGLFTTASPTF
jgi:hypothetical protein